MSAHTCQSGQFGLSVTRIAIDPGASLSDLMNDLSCLLGSTSSAADVLAQGDIPPNVARQWSAMIYLLRQSMAVFDRAYDAAHAVPYLPAGNGGGAQ